jgi:radical SAM superfamily enzyme YgiQ (UPF0313 family)
MDNLTDSAPESEDFVLLAYGRNDAYNYDAHTPLSILALGTYLETHGVAVEYFDERVQPQARLDRLLERGPRIVGLSVIGGHQIASSARISQRVRERAPDAFVIWGGVFPTTMCDVTVSDGICDAVALGEGEETLLELYEALGEGRSLDDVAGLAFIRDDEIHKTAPRGMPDVESLPFVYQGKALEMLRIYMERGSIRESVGYEGSRGCPFKCTFCYSPNFHSNTRTKSVEKVRDELTKLRALGVDDIDIYDDTLFGAMRRRFPEYLAILRELEFTWIGNLRINMLDEELLRDLETSGCRWIYFGIESNDDDLLRRMKKGINAEQIERGIELMSRSTLPAVFSLIYGLPYQSGAANLEDVLEFAAEIHRRHPEAEIQIQSFVPLPGTDLYPLALERGFEPPEGLYGWVEHDHFGVSSAWLDEPRLGPKIYLTSFLAYRYKRHLSHFPMKLVAYPLHKLSLNRLRRKDFGKFWEHTAYRAFTEFSKARTNLHYYLLDKRGDVETPA